MIRGVSGNSPISPKFGKACGNGEKFVCRKQKKIGFPILFSRGSRLGTHTTAKIKNTSLHVFCVAWAAHADFQQGAKNSAMPKSHSNLHHSIERTQFDRSTLRKNQDCLLLRGDIFL